MRTVVLIVLGTMLVSAVIVACNTREPGAQPTAAVPTAGPTIRPATTTPPYELRGFMFPVAGACLPENDALMPGAERAYRAGIHEGIDFYDSDNCVYMGVDSEILAAKAGKVVRADLDYEDLTSDETEELLRLIEEGRGSDPAVTDRFRGQQVWIDHGDGTVTRYAHLGEIAENVFVGKIVEQGEIIAYMGESGTPEAVSSSGGQVHLHFELRVGGGYLAQGQPTSETRALYEPVFAP